MRPIMLLLLLIIGSHANAHTPPVSDTFVLQMNELFVQFDQETFVFITGWMTMGLAIGLGGGWLYKAIRTR